jgi:hypothetical protein
LKSPQANLHACVVGCQVLVCLPIEQNKNSPAPSMLAAATSGVDPADAAHIGAAASHGY